MRSDIREGARFPDYELPDQAGKRRSLSELQGGNAMVLHLSRGGYDPKEHQFLGQLVEAYPIFRVAYTRLLVISTDNQLNTNEFRDALGATWPFLSDPDRLVQQDLDIKEFTDEPHDRFLVDTLEEPIRYTEGKSIGIKR
jgi:peroxiredoxin